jgi:hypothetical protein
MENKEISNFILDIGKKIEERSGAKLNFSQQDTVPKEEWIADPKVMMLGGISLRTAEQTQNMDVVKLKKFDPCFLLEQPKIPCRMLGCQETTVPSSSGKGRIKRDLFLCKTHRKKLTDLITKRCAEENVTIDVTSFKNDDFKGYTSLIGALEKAFMHLKSKRFTATTTDALLVEVFLNARNFLIITNASLNPDEDNTETVLGPYLTIFMHLLEDHEKMYNFLLLLVVISAIVFCFYGIIYPWVQVSLENPGAKIGFGVGMLLPLLSSLLGTRESDVPGWTTVLFCVACSFAGSFVGSGTYDWNGDPGSIEQRRQHIFQSQLQLVQLYRDFVSNLIHPRFVTSADACGNLSLKTEQNE